MSVSTQLFISSSELELFSLSFLAADGLEKVKAGLIGLMGLARGFNLELWLWAVGFSYDANELEAANEMEMGKWKRNVVSLTSGELLMEAVFMSESLSSVVSCSGGSDSLPPLRLSWS